MRERIPIWVACSGYVLFSVIFVIVIPVMFHQLKWYYVVVAYILAPSLSFCFLFLVKVLVPLAFIASLVILTYSFRTTLLGYAKKYKIQCGSCCNKIGRDPNSHSLNSTSRDIYVGTLSTDVRNVSSKSPDLKVFKFVDISAATNNFCVTISSERVDTDRCIRNEEFKNEVMLTTRLQHVNLVKVIGFCME